MYIRMHTTSGGDEGGTGDGDSSSSHQGALMAPLLAHLGGGGGSSSSSSLQRRWRDRASLLAFCIVTATVFFNATGRSIINDFRNQSVGKVTKQLDNATLAVATTNSIRGGAEKVLDEVSKPEETKPEQTKPEETKPEETKPEEIKPEEPPVIQKQKNTEAEEKELPEGAVSIRRNNNSTMAKDITSIYQDPIREQLVVTIRAGARCPHPHLTARLAGPALILVNDWVRTNNTLTGSYQGRLPLPGTYYLEIITSHCYDFSQEVRKHSNPSKWNFDFRKSCVEDPLRHRLTDLGVSIQIKDDNVHFEGPGYWENKYGNHSVPMYTRIQPHACVPKFKSRFDKTPYPKYCKNADTLDRFSPYMEKFQWAPKLNGLSTETLTQPKLTKVCAIGKSHSQRFEAAVRTGLGVSPEKHNVTLQWINHGYPDQVDFAAVKAQNCDKIVMAFGQWPLSSNKGPQHLFNQYYYELLDSFRTLRNTLPKHVEIFARSIHYSPLGWKRLACGAKGSGDSRTIPAYDAYNLIVERVCNDLNNTITYLDTQFVAAPMWDSSHDWNHLNHPIDEYEALYITGVLLGKVDPKSQSLVGYDASLAVEKKT